MYIIYKIVEKYISGTFVYMYIETLSKWTIYVLLNWAAFSLYQG